MPENTAIESNSILPLDGCVIYIPKLFLEEASQDYFSKLASQLLWQNDQLIIYGKNYTTARKVAFHGDQWISYNYSGAIKKALPWNNELLEIKEKVEQHCGTGFNACLLNLYNDGSEGMGWHSDDEKQLDPDSPIASVSFGATRRFLFRHKETNVLVEILLDGGSLLIMHPPTQKFWKHALPKSKKVTLPRINLTFRNFKSIQ